ncbi:MAG: 2-oxoglutarate dehydrogenase E1 component, partial [Bacteroidetes bacterium]|nr:2-oxoglutarate dehydrogenase E1 component [Bacteroidota bacterium]
MKDFQYVTNSSPAYIESLYQDFSKDPGSVDPEFKKFFEGFDFAITQGKNGSNGNGAAAAAKPAGTTYTTADGVDWKKELGAYRMILGYRNKGHLIAKTNPIRERKDRGANLGLAFFGFTEEDLDKNFFAGNLIGLGTTSLRNVLHHLQKCYADHVGIEFKYISDQVKIDWLTTEMEKKFLNPLKIDKQKRILQKLNEGVMFEKFLHTKYIGQKRFSLEGGETTIPALDTIINTASDGGVQEVVIGMAHRGRLNVLANIMGKTYEQIFSEFEGTAKLDQTMGSGDVKYHMGYGSELKTPSGNTIHLKLMPNPSHLEAVDPVVEGFSRAKSDVMYKSDYDKILPILI